MTKLLSASLLALGLMVTAPAAVAAPIMPVDHLYIQDTSKPIDMFFGQFGLPGIAYALQGATVYIGTIDHEGNMVDDWVELLTTMHVPRTNQAAEAHLQWTNPDFRTESWALNFLSYQPSSDAYELVFKWHNESRPEWVYYSEVLGLTEDVFPRSAISYGHSSIWEPTPMTTIGMEINRVMELDWNDVYITMSNIGPTGGPTPVIPEPETYAMMLAGLGLVGLVARRRRKSQ